MHSCVRWLQNGIFYEQFQLDALFDVTNDSYRFCLQSNPGCFDESITLTIELMAAFSFQLNKHLALKVIVEFI